MNYWRNGGLIAAQSLKIRSEPLAQRRHCASGSDHISQSHNDHITCQNDLITLLLTVRLPRVCALAAAPLFCSFAARHQASL